MPDPSARRRETLERAVVARWPAAFCEDALGLRTMAGCSIQVDARWAWLQGPFQTQEEILCLAQLRGVELFFSRGLNPGPGDPLFPVGFEASASKGRATQRGTGELPSALAPGGQWQGLSQWRSADLHLAEAPVLQGVQLEPVELALVRGGSPAPAAALVLPLEDFAAWAEGAPAHRLEPLLFAVDRGGRALVLGEPLPAIRGTLLWGTDGVLLPCGMTTEPTVSHGTIRTVAARTRSFKRGDTLVLEETGWSTVSADQWVKAHRSSVRASAARLTETGS